MRYGIIYKITCIINNKIYVGKTKKSAEKRFEGHKKAADKHKAEGTEPRMLITRAIIKYGPENFIIEQIDIAYSKEELNQKERYWIAQLQSRNRDIGYNITKGGDCGPGGPMFTGHKHSEETKANMSKNRIGSKNANYGNRWHRTSDMKYPDMHGENNSMFGKKQSDHQKELDSYKQTGVKFYSNKETDDVIRIWPGDYSSTEEVNNLINKLLNEGYYEGNWHCTKEYKLLKTK